MGWGLVSRDNGDTCQFRTLSDPHDDAVHHETPWNTMAYKRYGVFPDPTQQPFVL